MDELTLVREALDGAAEQVQVRPPSRAELDGGFRRVRVRRRLARTGKAAGTLAALATSLAVLQLGVVPLPAWVPAVPVTSGTTSALAAGPTRGSLAGDDAWLEALRAKIATFDRSESGGERWRAPSPAAVDVIYAGDVGEYRVAIVETPLRWGVIESRMQLSYLGVRGAAASEMAEGWSNAPEETAMVSLGDGSLPPEAGATGMGAVVVSSSVNTVNRQGPPVIAADGSISWATAELAPTAPGVWQLSMPANGPRTYLTWDGAEQPMLVGGWGWNSWQEADRAALLDGVRPARRDPSGPGVVSSVPGDERLAGSVGTAQFNSGQALGSSTRRLLWSGTLDGAPTDVVEVRVASGARAVVVNLPDRAPAQVQVVAAGKEPALAWRFALDTAASTETGPDGAVPVGNGPQRIGLLGPKRAVRAEITATAGARVAWPLSDGIGVAGAAGATSVRFLNEAGEVLAETDISDGMDASPLARPSMPGPLTSGTAG
jgi:hypothetical protein